MNFTQSSTSFGDDIALDNIKDLEHDAGSSRRGSHLVNDFIDNFAWKDLQVVVRDRNNGSDLSILSAAAGMVSAGEMLALMGPSGSGKTTLLNAIAHRVAAAGATTSGSILANGQQTTWKSIRDLSSYVEQEDALIGSLTVRETMIFAARLALPSSVSKKEAFRRVDDLISSFGLRLQAQTIVGTPIKKGLSGGQKKRLGVASRLVTDPKILFLDEPTSGLDSALSYEVIKYIRSIGKNNNLIIIASIHQPSSSTYQLFDKLCLLSKGKTCYFGPASEAVAYFESIGHKVPSDVNPAEFYLDLINVDLDHGGDGQRRVQRLTEKWAGSSKFSSLQAEIQAAIGRPCAIDISQVKIEKAAMWTTPLVLLQRFWIKSYRDIVAYGIRIVMYLGLAILMGTVFLRLKSEQTYIQPYINAIFFSSAFMSFMAVAYVPAFLEDRATFANERANGLVGPLAFVVSNFIIGIPFLFLIALLFSAVAYWLINFHVNAVGFGTFVFWLFLDLLAAESLVVLISCIFPVFVVALAFAAFANGLWMCVDGFLVPMSILNAFWKYAFHYIDYQAYVFQGMMVNEFSHRTFNCPRIPNTNTYQCMYVSDLNSQGKIRGSAVLEAFGIGTGGQPRRIGIMIGIIAGYRILAYLALRFRKA